MASDLKMEIFAYKQFYVWAFNPSKVSPMKSILQVYGDECTKVNNYSECCDDVYDKAIRCRLVLFQNLYIDSVDHNHVLSRKSLSDFHDFVNRSCDRDDLFGNLTIFEKIFSTLTYLICYCLIDYQESPVGVLNYIHVMWAMYFDKFIDEFYKEGGWNELRQVAETYIAVYNLFESDGKKIRHCNYITSLKEATINYCHFQNAINHKHKEEIHISILWVKHSTKYFEEAIIVSSMLLNHDDCFEIEILLQNLKRLCNVSQNYYHRVESLREKYKKSVWNSQMLYSKMHNQEIEGDDNLATSQCFQSSKSIVSHDIICKNEHLENSKECSVKTAKPKSRNKSSLDGYSQYECHNTHDELLNLRLESNTKMSREIADLDKKPFSSIDRENEINFHGCSDGCENLQFEAKEASKVISMNQDSFKGCRKPSKNLFSPSDLCFGNQTEGHDLCTAKQTEKHDLCTVKQTEEQDLCFGNLIEERSDLTKKYESKLHSSFEKENEFVYSENAEITDVLSTYQTSTDCCNKKKILNNACAAKVDTTNNIEEKIINHDERDKLRKEQNDPEIGKLLRMIMILGDTQGNHNVHGEVSGNEESREISQIKLSKKKKRSKK